MDPIQTWSHLLLLDNAPPAQRKQCGNNFIKSDGLKIPKNQSKFVESLIQKRPYSSNDQCENV